MGPADILLLRVCVEADPEAARQAWAQLEPQLDVRVLLGEAYGLLPLLHKRLSDIAPAYPDLQLLKGVRQRHWYGNNMSMQEAARASAALKAGGHDALVGGGAAVVLRCLSDHSLLALPAFELVVPEDTLEDAAELLMAEGWHGQSAGRNGPTLERRALTLRGVKGQPLTVQEGSDSAFEGSPDALDLHGCMLRTVAMPHLLVSVIVDTGRALEGPAMRWLADASLLTGRLDAASWDRVPEVARKRKASLRVGRRLRQLETLLDASVPARVHRELDAAPKSRREAMAERVQANDRGGRTFAALLRRTAGMGPISTVTCLPRHFAEVRPKLQPAASRNVGRPRARRNR